MKEMSVEIKGMRRQKSGTADKGISALGAQDSKMVSFEEEERSTSIALSKTRNTNN